MTGQHAPDPREAMEAIHRYGRSMATSARARGNDEEERRWLDLLINADAVLDAAVAQDTADPADGLTEDWVPRHGDVACYEDCVQGGEPYRVTIVWRHRDPAQGWFNAAGTMHPLDVTGKRLHLLVRDGHIAARQRPTRQADTDRAVVEAVLAMADDIDAMADRQSKAHNVDGAVGIRWAADMVRAAIAAAREPTSGHHHDEAGT